MLETDNPETINEMIMSVRKMGRLVQASHHQNFISNSDALSFRCGIIAAYAALANHVNVGALMEKGVRLIGNGQGQSATDRRSEGLAVQGC